MKMTHPHPPAGGRRIHPEHRRRIIISGGHLTPALAVIEILKEKNWAILFVGRKYSLEGEKIPSIESKIISQKGIPFVAIGAGRIQRRFSLQTIPSILRIPSGFFQALFWFLKYKSNVFLSFGGYVAAPLALASWLCQVPIVTHVQSIKPGLADRFIGFLARTICFSWRKTQNYFPSKKTVFTGNPLREKLLKSQKISKKEIIQKPPLWLSRFNLNLPVIYITGGGQGSTWINQVLKLSLPRLKNYFLIHQCGVKDYQAMIEFRNQLTSSEKKRYFVKDWFPAEKLGTIFVLADLVVGRSGANTVFEVAAFSKPAIFIPLPWAGDNEQMTNAQKLAALGMVKILPQEKLTPENFINAIEENFSCLNHLKKAAQKAQKFFFPKAAELIVQEIEKHAV